MAPLIEEVMDFYRQAKTHKRYTLRLSSIVAILVGSFLNFISFFIAITGNANGPKHITVWTGITYCIAISWNLFDLASHSDRIFQNKQFLSVFALLFIDGLGFWVFLTLLIANGIITGDIRWERGPAILYTYNSVPWMICCVVHGIMALQSLYGILINIGYRSTCCPDCGRKAKNDERRSDNGAKHSLLRSTTPTDDDDDLEANATSTE